LRLNGTWKLAELDEYGNELPMIVLDALQRDLALPCGKLARRSPRLLSKLSVKKCILRKLHS